jgi:ferredoxin/flavodoxin
MERNMIFYFSGTGNSLKAAKDIASGLENCEIIGMGRPYPLNGSYDRIGFVFPSYAMGPPPRVERFISELSLSENKSAYYFSVVTCGQSSGNCLASMSKLLADKGVKLGYGNSIVMFASYVALYAMADNPAEKAAAANAAIKPIALEIANKSSNGIPKAKPALSLVHSIFAKTLPNKDKGFIVSEKCTSCGMCEKICPVNNIVGKNGKPAWLHHCEQCMACVQWCPESAINYKNKTQNRGRYHHPDISFEEMCKK